MVLGILSLVVLPFVLGPIAWVMGHNDMQKIHAGRMDPEGEGMTNTGKICGMIGTIMGIIFLVLACVWIAFLVMLLSTAAH
jgi:hypothetical protein